MLKNLRLPKPVLILITVSTLLILIFISLKSCSSNNDEGVWLESLPQTPNPDGDSPADTIKTLTASVSALLDDVRSLRQDTQETQKHNQGLIDRIVHLERDLSSKLDRELSNRSQADARIQGQQREKIEQLENRILNLTEDIAKNRGRFSVAGKTNQSSAVNEVNQYRWHAPLAGTAAAEQSISSAESVYTIPKNAVLVGSTTLTALIGRVPVEDRVRDPMPFKVITGNDNLAANGHTIPNLRGTVWSGKAIGDWTLSCVTGSLTSVTFIFDDGTIRTIDGESTNSLGWISDAYGVPCLPGNRVSNFKPLIAAHLASGAITGAANAAALAETERSSNTLGGVNSAVTGDIAKFMIGKSIAQSSQSMTAWLNERSRQEFDAVLVNAGQDIVLHIDQELHIDYHPTGRKLTHAKNQNTQFAGLD